MHDHLTHGQQVVLAALTAFGMVFGGVAALVLRGRGVISGAIWAGVLSFIVVYTLLHVHVRP